MSILLNSPNFFLSSLPPQDAALLQPHLKFNELPAASVLYKAEEAITRVYFPYTGIVSFMVGVATGEFVEAGVVGRNSAIGVSASLDGGIAINEAIVRVAMSAAMVDAAVLKRLAGDRETLRVACARHEEMTLG